MHEKKHKCTAQICLFFVFCNHYVHAHKNSTHLQTHKRQSYKHPHSDVISRWKGREELCELENSPAQTLGYILEGTQLSLDTITTLLLTTLWRIWWELDEVKDGERCRVGRGSKGKVGETERVWERTEVSSFLCGWLCLTVFVHACVHFLTCIAGCLSALACKQKAWLIWTSYELYVLVCALFLYGHKGEVASAEAKMWYAGGGETSLLVC